MGMANSTKGNGSIILMIFMLVVFASPPDAFSGEDLEVARKLFQAGKYREAIVILEQNRKKNPSDFDALFLLGRAYAETGKHKKAINLYKKAMMVNPEDLRSLIEMGICYSKMEMPYEAIEIFEKVVEKEPSNAAVHFYLGVGYEKVRSMNKAWEQYQILKTLDKKLAEELYKVIFW